MNNTRQLIPWCPSEGLVCLGSEVGSSLWTSGVIVFDLFFVLNLNYNSCQHLEFRCHIKRFLAFWIRKQSGNTTRVPLAEAIVIDLVIGHGWWVGWQWAPWVAHALAVPLLVPTHLLRRDFLPLVLFQPARLTVRWSAGPLVAHFRQKSSLCRHGWECAYIMSRNTCVWTPHKLAEWELGHFFISLCFQFPFHFLGSLLDILPSL